MASISKYVTKGYGQVEPNHLSAQRNGKIYAQLPADSTLEQIENGMFVKYDLAKGKVNLTGEGEWMLVFNEEKTYEANQTRKDFVMTTENQIRGIIVPRVFKTDIGDIYTTNMVVDAEYAEEDKLTVDTATGVLKAAGEATEFIWQIAKLTTMPDGQKAVKLVRIA